MTRRRIGTWIAGAYLAVAAFILVTFLMAPPDGLANVWIVLWTAPLSLPSFLLPLPMGFDVMVGKHGDHVGGEREAARALLAGEVDAACMIDGNSLLFAQEGTLPRGSVRVLTQTKPYDHCNFTVLDGAPEALVQRFTELLLGMRYDDPAVRPLLDLEGLKAWRPGRTSGYALLADACDRFGWLQPFLARMGA